MAAIGKLFISTPKFWLESRVEVLPGDCMRTKEPREVCIL
jgi:hypothetical protein